MPTAEVVEVLRRLGGVATRAVLIEATSRAEVDRAIRRGAVAVGARGRYAVPEADDAVRRAHELSGVLALTSAAIWHGWEVKTVPERPHVIVPRRRKVSAGHRRNAEVHYADLHPDDIASGIATGVEATLTACFRSLPIPDGLAVGDSALRHGVPPSVLRRVATSVRGPRSPRVRWVARHACAEAANPFESVLRAIALTVPGLAVQPQRLIRTSTLWARPDLVDQDLRIVLEADSFEWHGDRRALRKDARRYNLLVVDGWLVLRFAWEDVIHDPDYVRSVLVALLARVTTRAEVDAAGRFAA